MPALLYDKRFSGTRGDNLLSLETYQKLFARVLL